MANVIFCTEPILPESLDDSVLVAVVLVGPLEKILLGLDEAIITGDKESVLRFNSDEAFPIEDFTLEAYEYDRFDNLHVRTNLRHRARPTFLRVRALHPQGDHTTAPKGRRLSRHRTSLRALRK